MGSDVSVEAKQEVAKNEGKQRKEEKMQRCREALRKQELQYCIENPEGDVMKAIVFSDSDVFCVLVWRANYVDDDGKAKKLQLHSEMHARKHNIVLLSEVEFVAAGGGLLVQEIIKEASAARGANEKV